MARRRPQLQALARAVGLIDRYVDGRGVARETSNDVRVELLEALGFEVRTESCAREALLEMRQSRRGRLLAPVRVLRRGEPGAGLAGLRVGRGDRPREWSLELLEEGGRRHALSGRSRSRAGLLRVHLPGGLPLGYHRLRASVGGAGAGRSGDQSLIVAPRRCVSPEELGIGRAAGLWTNLYSVRSAANRGFGDLGDLTRLVRQAARQGADFVGLNPLAALRNTARERSPYSPLTRLYRNPLYLELSAVPELAHSKSLQRKLRSPAWALRLEKLRGADRIDYDAQRQLARELFVPLHRAFRERHGAGATARGRAYLRYLEAQGQPLTDHATFLTLEEKYGKRKRSWPAAYRDPSSPELDLFRRRQFRTFDLHRYLQFELDRQLGRVAATGRRLGMKLGLYQDLPIGAVKDGSDAWALKDQLVHGVSLGAPPDGFTREGQIWNLPPLNPLALEADGYRHWTRLLRSTFRHAGALRIDHVIGLVRQFWIPVGHRGTEGALMRFPARDLFGILALESRRHSALVVGEDIGTLPKELPGLMKEYGLLSSRVLLFDPQTRKVPARVFLTSSTHDHTPLPGYLKGLDLQRLRRLGLIESDSALAEAQAQREEFTRALLRRLRRTGCLSYAESPSMEEVIDAIHLLMGRSRALLVAFSLDDLVGETTPINIPGVTGKSYPCWTRRMRVSLEQLTRNMRARPIKFSR